MFKKVNALYRVVKGVYHKYMKNFLCFNRKVKCNICGWGGARFVDYDAGYEHVYKNGVCPSCKSMPRHRSFYVYLKRKLDKHAKIKLLHFSPEDCFKSFLRSYKNIEYLSVDITPGKAMRKEDITDLSFNEASFDAIICSHVLEHVDNDRKAMEELFRVLKKNGFALIDVPIDYNNENTLEDSSIKTPEARTRSFWQWNHVRLYGRDFPDRLKSVGFKVQDVWPFLGIKNGESEYFGLREKPIYVCEK